MSAKTFPYTAWVLMPSYKPRCVEFVRDCRFLNTHQSAKGKRYRVRDIHESQDAAVIEGHKRIDEQQSRLDKQLVTLQKRRAVLKAAK